MICTLPELKSGTLNDAMVFVEGTRSVKVNVVAICEMSVILGETRSNDMLWYSGIQDSDQQTFESVSTLTSTNIVLYLYNAPTSPADRPPFFVADEVIACNTAIDTTEWRIDAWVHRQIERTNEVNEQFNQLTL